MQLDENTANSVVTRPTAEAAGAVRWFRERNLGGGITGTTMDADFLNDLLGNLIAVLAAGSITRTKGASGDSDLLNAIKAIFWANTPPSALDGQLVRTGNATIELQPVHGNDIAVAIDNVVIRKTGVLAWDMASNLEGSETPSTPYYLYAENDAGALVEKISAAAPDLPGDTKSGYEAGDASFRCLGSVWNNSANAFVPSTYCPGGVVRFHEHDGDHEHTLQNSQQTSWHTEIALNLPVTALLAKINASGEWDTGEGMVVFGAEGASGTLTNGSKDTAAFADILAAHVVDGTSSKDGYGLQFDLPIKTPAAPKLAYGLTENMAASHRALVLGYTDIFAPR